MKIKAVVGALALSTLVLSGAAAAYAQDASNPPAPGTMNPIPNPPETPKKASHHARHAKKHMAHHAAKKAAAPAAAPAQ